MLYNGNVGLLTYICVTSFRELCVCGPPGEITSAQCLSVHTLLDMCVFFIDLLSSGVFFIDLHASLPRVPWHRFIDGGFPPRQYQVSQLAGDLHSVQCTPAWSFTKVDFKEGRPTDSETREDLPLSSGWRFQVVGFENKWREILLSTYFWNVASHSLK